LPDRGWPRTPAALAQAQRDLARAEPLAWRPAEGGPPLTAGCFVCFSRGASGRGRAGERAWAAAAVGRGSRRPLEVVVVRGEAGAPYEPGLLALREGPLLEAAIRALGSAPEVVVANATGRDHPRGAGLALHLGAVLDLPTVGVTDRPLLATGSEPAGERGSAAALRLDGREVARFVRTRAGARPVVAHPGWRTELETATAVVLACTGRTRTPEPLRRARQAARRARAADGS
jgi:deoxyribonuclease V